jgi:hypothetical protein
MSFIFQGDPIRIVPICVFRHISLALSKAQACFARCESVSWCRPAPIVGGSLMFDLLFIVIAVVAFVATALYLPACDGW